MAHWAAREQKMGGGAQLKKLQQEKENLASELEMLQQAENPETVCSSVVEFVASKPEPFDDPNNAWIRNPGTGCCTVL